MAFHEKMLILSRDTRFTTLAQDALKAWGVDILHVLNDPDVLLAIEEYHVLYNILIIDKEYRGNARETARLVRKIRKEYFDPIIGIAFGDGSGDLLSLQVAGCNFTQQFGAREQGIHKAVDWLINVIPTISGELAAPYHSES